MRIGYARVSTHEQNLDLQRDALQQVGCDKIIEDAASGKKLNRSGLDHARELLRQGDTLVVWRLDRLGRSLKQLIELMGELERQGIGFQSITEAIDTTTPGGKLVFHMFGALAEFERNVIRERTQAGLTAARARGRLGGRPKKLGDKQRALAVELYRQGTHTADEICRTVGITRPTLYAYVHERRDSGNAEDSAFGVARRAGLIGSIEGAPGSPTDLSTNPKHMEGFGRE